MAYGHYLLKSKRRAHPNQGRGIWRKPSILFSAQEKSFCFGARCLLATAGMGQRRRGFCRDEIERFLQVSFGEQVFGLSTVFMWRYLFRGAWVAQLAAHLTLAQVIISWVVSSSPTSDSVLTVLCFWFCVPLSLCSSPALSLSLSRINKHSKKFKKKIPFHYSIGQTRGAMSSFTLIPTCVFSSSTSPAYHLQYSSSLSL